MPMGTILMNGFPGALEIPPCLVLVHISQRWGIGANRARPQNPVRRRHEL